MANTVVTHTATKAADGADTKAESATTHDAQPSKEIIDGLGQHYSTHSPKLTSEL